jgi:transcriptional regulator with XRE-family HTH domain
MSEKDKANIGRNLKHLRKLRKLTQQDLADQLGINRSNIGAYEECRAAPKYDTLRDMSDFFGVSMDNLVKEDLSGLDEDDLKMLRETSGTDVEGRHLRILPITVDEEGNEKIQWVNQSASAGYLNGYADPEFIEELPRVDLPFLGPGTFRAFEIRGDSMLPLPSGSVVIGEYVANFRDVKNGETYVVISKSEGIVYKRLYLDKNANGKEELRLVSDNLSYQPYSLPLDDIQEIWRSRFFLMSEVPQATASKSSQPSELDDIRQQLEKLSHLPEEIEQLKKELDQLKRK